MQARLSAPARDWPAPREEVAGGKADGEKREINSGARGGRSARWLADENQKHGNESEDARYSDDLKD
jgi:hypothetical protein